MERSGRGLGIGLAQALCPGSLEAEPETWVGVTWLAEGVLRGGDMKGVREAGRRRGQNWAGSLAGGGAGGEVSLGRGQTLVSLFSQSLAAGCPLGWGHALPIKDKRQEKGSRWGPSADKTQGRWGLGAPSG